MKKIVWFFSLVLILAPVYAGALTVPEIQQQISNLQAQLQQLQNGNTASNIPSACVGITFNRNLKPGSTGADVKCLQAVLNISEDTQIASTGSGSPGHETTIFGLRTKTAVMKFQAKYQIPPIGLVGALTRAKLNTLLTPQVSFTPITPVISAPPATPAPSLSVADVINKALPASVSIIISQSAPQYEVVYENPFGNDPRFQDFNIQIPVFKPTGQTVSQPVGAGSGFIVNSNGYIITNRHVVANTSALYTVLLTDGTQHSATVVYKDDQHDLAMLKIEGSNYPTETLGDSSTLTEGEQIVILGNAFGTHPNTVSTGTISGLNRTIQAYNEQGQAEILTNIIETNAITHPGNSGGPLLDLQGNVVAVSVALAEGKTNASYSIPINAAKNMVAAVIGN